MSPWIISRFDLSVVSFAVQFFCVHCQLFVCFDSRLKRYIKLPRSRAGFPFVVSIICNDILVLRFWSDCNTGPRARGLLYRRGSGRGSHTIPRAPPTRTHRTKYVLFVFLIDSSTKMTTIDKDTSQPPKVSLC